MISATQKGLEEALRFKQKASLSLEYLPAKSVAVRNEKAELFFSSLIASFANSNGGTIFIGVAASRKTPKHLEPLDDEECVQWLEMVCRERISPEIPNCIVEKIVVDESGKFVVGISVPNSSTAPHISCDNRFYKRSANSTVLLEEYEIRDLYTKGKRSEIELFGVTNTGGIPTLSAGKFQTVNFYPRFLVKNTGNCVEQFYKVEFAIPSALNNPNFNTMVDNFSRFDDGNSVYSFAGKSALFQGEIASVVEPNVFVNAGNYDAFEKGEVQLTFFFSSGVRTKKFHCKELFLYRNKMLEKADFVGEQQELIQ